MLLDELVPRWDATRIEHRVVDAPRSIVYSAVGELDFLDVPREIPAVRALFAARAVGERTVALLCRRPVGATETPATMRLRDLDARGDWVSLGEVADTEIAFGAIGRFWAGETAWRQIDPADFSTFAEPGYARVGCNMSLRDYGARTLVSYEARTLATDAAARTAFLRYWWVVGPFVGVVMRGTLRLLDRTVTAGPSSADP